jgi:hypothetical protein
MKRKLSILKLTGVLLMAGVVFGAVKKAGSALHFSPVASMLVACLALVALFAAPSRAHDPNTMVMGIEKEIWEDRIEENLFDDNEFLMCSVDDSQYASVLTVHIPNAGATPNVEVNRAKGGASVDKTQRTDREVTYEIDELTTDPFLITDAEEKQLSYSKVDSELYDHRSILTDKLASRMLNAWAPTGAALLADGVTTNNNILRSTGIPNNDENAVPVVAVAYLTGATGNRLRFGLYDIRQAKKLMDKQKVAKTGRHILLSADAYDQIVGDLVATKYRDSMTQFDTATGELSAIMGFKVHTRASTVAYNNANTPVVKAWEAAAAATDNDAILCWHERSVSRAVGDIKVYETLGSADDYGDVYSALVRAGGSKRRTTEVGVVAIVQAAAA